MEFARGSCLMREGSSGDACYVVTSGQVRIEVERPDTAGDGVVAHLGPGEVCGEFSVLDDSSRSASAYANTDVVARRLSVPALRTLCERDPATGIAVLRWLSRHAAHKAREFSANLQEFLFTGEPDPEADAMVASAVAVQAGFVSLAERAPVATSTWVDVACAVMLAESTAIRAAADRMADGITRAVEVIQRHPGKVVVTGIGKSGHVGRRMAATLCSTGTPAVFLHATEAVHGDLGVYVPGDPTILGDGLRGGGDDQPKADGCLGSRTRGDVGAALRVRARDHLLPGHCRQRRGREKEAQDVHAIRPERVGIKIPCTAENLAMAVRLRRNGIGPIGITAVFTPAQVVLAAEVGAEFVLPYVSRLTRLTGDGLAVVADMAGVLRGSRTQILAASVKAADEAVQTLRAGAQHLTLPLNLLEGMGESPHSHRAIEEFAQAMR